jgi:hypothetical protein
MMATKHLAHTTGVQDSNPQQVWRAYEAIMQKRYPGVENMVGAQFWGTNELATTGLHNEVLYHTGLLGSAAKLGRDLRTPVPMATYKTVDQVVADYEVLGIGFEYYPDELEDFLYPEVVLDKLGDLPLLLADAEEDEHFAAYNNGETLTGGWTADALFVDGSTKYLQTIGESGVNRGSNIITTAGGPSYHLISLVDQYGQNFVNEEGRVSPLMVDRVMCSPQNARLLDLYYGASYNIEQDKQAIPNPAMSRPQVIPTHRLANANDMIFFFQGWDEDLKERSKWRGQAMTETVGDLNEKRVVSIIRSRYAYYWFFNRRVLLVKGAA